VKPDPNEADGVWTVIQFGNDRVANLVFFHIQDVLIGFPSVGDGVVRAGDAGEEVGVLDIGFFDISTIIRLPSRQPSNSIK
jgi:hypothetical protein